MTGLWTPRFDQRVRVTRDLPSCGERVFMWCEQRPEPCAIHGHRHSGNLRTNGHHIEEAGITGEIAATLGGMNGGHPWVVRYDRILTIEWPNGMLLRVNSGTYRAEELEPLDVAPG